MTTRAAVALMVASFALHEVGAAVHATVASLSILLVGVHLWQKRRFLQGVMRRAGRRGLPRRLTVDVIFMIAVLALAALTAVTGVVELLGSGGTPHGGLALLLIVVGIAHAVRHLRRGGKVRGAPDRLSHVG
jgi:heme exporter protein D